MINKYVYRIIWWVSGVAFGMGFINYTFHDLKVGYTGMGIGILGIFAGLLNKEEI